MKKFLFILIGVFFIAGYSRAYPAIVKEFSGYVLNMETHAPIEEARVTVKELNRFSLTDKNGFFSFNELDSGTYTIEISHTLYASESILMAVSPEVKENIKFYLLKKSFQTPAITVTDNFEIEGYEDLLELSSVLQGKELERNLSMTLAATLKDETGLSIRSMGPAPSRPVYRGLTGDRVLISEDGIKTNDISATSPDHSVALESFTVDKIEVLRGPQVLLQTATTLGGVINIIRNEIPSEQPEKITGSVGIFGESVNKGYLGAIRSMLPVKPFTFTLELSGRNASDINTPGGTLINTELSNFNFSAGGSYIDKDRILGGSFRQYNSAYGIPGGFIGAHPEGVDIELERSYVNIKYEEKELTGFFHNFIVDVNRGYFHQSEYEKSDLIGAEFRIVNYDGKADISHHKAGIFNNGTFGSSFEYRDFEIGGYVFTPFTTSYKQAVYLYENLLFNKFIMELSARYEYNSLNPDDSRYNNNSTVRKRTYNTYSLSLSGIYEAFEGFFISGNVSRSSRVPTIEELYSQGPHLAAYSYEIGNPELEPERGIGMELSLYYKNPQVYFMLTGFRNDFSYYITPRNSGDTNYATLLPIYRTAGLPALMYGAEAQAEINIFKNISVSSSLSYTFGEFKETGSPLPGIPPLKSITGISYSSNNFNAGFSTEIASRQDRVDEFEQPTEGYMVWSAFSQLSLFTKNIVHNISFSVDNIFDKEYRNHLSRVKSILPEAGRNFRLTYKMYF